MKRVKQTLLTIAISFASIAMFQGCGGGTNISSSDELPLMENKLDGKSITDLNKSIVDMFDSDDKSQFINLINKLDFNFTSVIPLGDKNTEQNDNQHIPPPTKVHTDKLDVLAYNIFMMKTGNPLFKFFKPSIFKTNQAKRTSLISKYLKETKKNYDVIIFSESFDNDLREEMNSNLIKKYPYITNVIGDDADLPMMNGGVFIMSKYPITYRKEKAYGSLGSGYCYGEDCLAKKGFLYIEVVKNNRNYHIIGTHTQAQNHQNIRKKQFKKIKNFIDDNIPNNDEVVLIGGDLNVDMYNNPELQKELKSQQETARRYHLQYSSLYNIFDNYDKKEYETMLKILNSTHPEKRGHKFTWDSKTNHYAKNQENGQEYLDYILYSNNHLKPILSYNEVIKVKIGGKDLSDHYPVHGHFEFTSITDKDGDGINDDIDNCPNHTNKNQTDLDGDGLGNICDPDMDGDGIFNRNDNCMLVSNLDQKDKDYDGIGNVCDLDILIEFEYIK
jgi:endonuclease/exonuclease/phosphatase family metal-dependent hydrolase